MRADKSIPLTHEGLLAPTGRFDRDGEGFPRCEPSSFVFANPAPEGIPADVAVAIIRAYSQPLDLVVDPFGEGFEPLGRAVSAERQAVMLARRPLTHRVALAGLKPPDARKILKRIADLQSDLFYGDPEQTPQALWPALDTQARARLSHLREQINCHDPVDGAVATLAWEWLANGLKRPPVEKKTVAHPEDATDLFDALVEIQKTWERRRARRRAARRTPFPGRVWPVFNARQRTRYYGALQTKRIPLAVGAPAPMRPDADIRHLAWDEWLMGQNAPPSRTEATRTTDVPGYVSWLTTEALWLHKILEPGGMLALWLKDPILDGRPKRRISLGARLLTALRDNAIGFEYEDCVTPTAKGRAPAPYLLLLRKTSDF